MNDFESSRRRIIEMASSDPARALTLASQFVNSHPNLSAAWSVRSHVLWLLGRRDDALIDSDKAILCEPNEPSNYFHKGDYLLEIEEFADAVDLFSTTIELSEQYEFRYYESSARMFRAYCYCKIGMFEKALKDLDQIDDMDTVWIDRTITKRDLLRACRDGEFE